MNWRAVRSFFARTVLTGLAVAAGWTIGWKTLLVIAAIIAVPIVFVALWYWAFIE